METTKGNTLVETIENFILRFVTFPDNAYTLPIALWIIGTYIWHELDAFAYMVITADTKRSGKTRLAELISFVCNEPLMSGGATAAGIFQALGEADDAGALYKAPTMFFDEAESISSESASMLRTVLNMGYRRGQSILRAGAKWNCYSPKVFILIGDVYDTLRDRSIVIRMRRGEPRERFVYAQAQMDGEQIGMDIRADVDACKQRLLETFTSHEGLQFLTDRDEEIWLPLFAICKVIAPHRLSELMRTAVDMATEKTIEKRRYIDVAGEEKKIEDDEYSRRLLLDVQRVIGKSKSVSTVELLNRLFELPTAPWRKFRGGLTVHMLSDMLSRYGVRPVNISIGSGRENRKVVKGYKSDAVERACKGITSPLV